MSFIFHPSDPAIWFLLVHTSYLAIQPKFCADSLFKLSTEFISNFCPKKIHRVKKGFFVLMPYLLSKFRITRFLNARPGTRFPKWKRLKRTEGLNRGVGVGLCKNLLCTNHTHRHRRTYAESDRHDWNYYLSTYVEGNNRKNVSKRTVHIISPYVQENWLN